jgi:hypothetical protein
MVTSSSVWKHGEPFPFVIGLHLGSVISSNISLNQTSLTRKIYHTQISRLTIFYLNVQQDRENIYINLCNCHPLKHSYLCWIRTTKGPNWKKYSLRKRSTNQNEQCKIRILDDLWKGKNMPFMF